MFCPDPELVEEEGPYYYILLQITGPLALGFETVFSVNVDHHGVEQAFRPAIKLLKKSALAAEVFSGGYGNLETGLVVRLFLLSDIALSSRK
jgi:hypothetical protein